ncbi:MAG: 4Fe-4S single cluster domain-containing protein [Eubacteriales bacterium]
MPKIHHYVESTTALGPGLRSAVWFQGCEKRCLGCINVEAQLIEGGYPLSIETLFHHLTQKKDLTGVTISGGEPFLQWDALKTLVSRIKLETKLDIMLFSGYTLGELLPKYGESFFKQIDLFVDGEYKEDLDENQLFRGSANQNIYSFTGKYEGFLEQIRTNRGRTIEFQVLENQDSFLVGIPPKNFYQELLNQIRKEETT